MKNRLLKWIRIRYDRVLSSIAFYPIIIAFLFLGLSILMFMLDFSETGKSIKSSINWLRLNDASTARSIISAIAAGIISLTVFSFSMVMIVLNQAASQMSNRVLDNLIGNRFQQVVLGIYIGTIVYALFLLSTIRDIDSGIYIPALSIYLLIALTIIDIFIFIYFLHYITRSVKYETIIHRIYQQTMTSMKKTCHLTTEPTDVHEALTGPPLLAEHSGIYQGFDKAALLRLIEKENLSIAFLHPTGTFVVEGFAIATLSRKVDDEVYEQLRLLVNVHRGDEIDNSYYYGIRQLVEVAVKALSPGVNDPGTAIVTLRALTGLLVYRLKHYSDHTIKSNDGNVRIVVKEKTFEELFQSTILPLWDYGKNDRLLRHELSDILHQLQQHADYPAIHKLVQEVKVHSQSI